MFKNSNTNFLLLTGSTVLRHHVVQSKLSKSVRRQDVYCKQGGPAGKQVPVEVFCSEASQQSHHLSLQQLSVSQ